MSTVQPPVGEMLVTVKSREVQRGILAEMARDSSGATPHFLAAAHLELVLANDYEQAGRPSLAFRSRLSAASCFWRAGQPEQARQLFNSLLKNCPDQLRAVQDAVAELERDYPSCSRSP